VSGISGEAHFGAHPYLQITVPEKAASVSFGDPTIYAVKNLHLE
jgi:hypothetical protein